MFYERCIDPQIGRLLTDAVAGALDQPERAIDRERFRHHTIECLDCREAVISNYVVDRANLPDLEGIGRANVISMDELLDQLRASSQQLKSTAQKHGISLKQVLSETLDKAVANIAR